MLSLSFSTESEPSARSINQFARFAVISLMLACATLSVPAQTAGVKAGSRLTEKDRQFAIEQLKASHEKFTQSVAGLSEAQLKFKSTPDRWSIAEVAEHITVTEPFLYGLLTNAVLKSPAAPDKERKLTDEIVLATVKDRSAKAQAPEPAKPTGRWTNISDTMAEFEKQRTRTIDFVKTTQADLRSHFSNFGSRGEIDGLQWILVISALCERHVAQINEVKADPNFPKK